MQPLEKTQISPNELNNSYKAFLKRYDEDPKFAAQFPGDREEFALNVRAQILLTADSSYVNDVYHVVTRECEFMGTDGLHISIKRHDRKPIHDWRDLQEIKNQIAGVECEAIELYPAESRRVDTANQYHLWCSSDPKFRFSVGFETRLVMEDPPGKAVQRAFE